VEVVTDHETGVIVAQDASAGAIFAAIDSIQNNLAQMEVRCREAFERHYGDEVVRHATRALLDLVHS
jgi:ribosome-associated translation inhibitor RaiA